MYLRICEETSQLVHAALERDAPRWCLGNACSACTYTLKDEQELHFMMLVTMDGNDSLKCIWGCITDSHVDGETCQPSESKEVQDHRDVKEDYHLPCEDINRWERAAPVKLLKDNKDDNPCTGHWTNMVDEVTPVCGVFLMKQGYFYPSAIMVLCSILQTWFGVENCEIDLCQYGEQTINFTTRPSTLS